MNQGTGPHRMDELHPITRLALGGLMALGASLSWAQTQSTRVQASLNVQATAIHSTAPVAGVKPGSDLILSAVPGISVTSKGVNTQIEAQGQLNALNYTRGTQPDRVLPSGDFRLRTGTGAGGPGLDASASVSQVRSTLAARPSDTPSTADSFTNTIIRVSPFWDKELDSQTTASVRLDRTVLHTDEVGPGLVARPDSHLSNDSLRLSRRPTPLGYRLEWHQQQTKVSGQADPSLNERIGRVTALYAPGPEVEMGLSVGRGSNRVAANTITETTHGAQLQWRPTDRTVLKSEVENRFYGRSWLVDASHRTPWLAFGLQADRTATTYASTIGNVANGGSLRTLYDALLTTRIPNEAERRRAVDDMVVRRNLSGQVSTSGDVYDVAAQLRQSTTGRVALMGRRDVVIFAGGLVRTGPLNTDTAAPSLIAGTRTKEYYFDAQVNHQLTTYSTVSTGLRWTRAWTTPTDTGAATLSRDFTWRASLNTTLSPQTTATMGLRRQLTHNPSTTTSDEAAMFVGLGHRF